MIRLLGSSLVTLLFLAGCQTTSPGTGGPGPISDPEPRPLSIVFQENQNDSTISIFAKAVLQTDLTSLLSEPVTVGEEGVYTVFVPSNATFDTYFQTQGVNEQEFLDAPDLASFIKSHIVEDNAAGEVLASKSSKTMTFETLNGNQLTLRMEGEGCFSEPPKVRNCTFIVNEAAQQDNELTYQQKYRATNGELLVIDEVLIP